MTPRQAQIFNFVKSYIAENGSSPSVEEVARNILCTKSYASYRINELIEQNYLKRHKKTKRSLEVVIHYCPYCKGNLSTYEAPK